jgi:hypothetical protein
MKDNRKHGLILTALILAAGLGLAGCSKSNPTGPAPTQNTGPGGAEVAKVEKAFASADASLRFPVDDTLRIVKAGAYADALPSLRKLAGNARLTPEQKQALQELIQKLETTPGQVAPR